MAPIINMKYTCVLIFLFLSELAHSQTPLNNIIHEEYCIQYDTSHSALTNKDKFIFINDKFDDSVVIYVNGKFVNSKYVKSGVHFYAKSFQHKLKFKGERNIIAIRLVKEDRVCQFYFDPRYLYVTVHRDYSPEGNLGAWSIIFSNKIYLDY